MRDYQTIKVSDFFCVCSTVADAIEDSMVGCEREIVTLITEMVFCETAEELLSVVSQYGYPVSYMGYPTKVVINGEYQVPIDDNGSLEWKKICNL